MSLKLYDSLIFISVLLTTGLIPYISNRKEVKGAKELLFLTCTIDFWLVCQLLYLSVESDAMKLMWHELKFVGVVFAPIAMFIISIELCNLKRLIDIRVLSWFLIMPVVTLLVIATNPLHHWFRKSIAFENYEGFRLIFPVNGMWYWINMYYLLVMVGVTMIFFLVNYIRAKKNDRIQYLVFLIAGGFPWVMSILYNLILKEELLVDLTPLGLTMTTLVLIWGVFFQKLMNINPVAGYEVYHNIKDCILVFDLNERIQHMNPAAKRMLGIDASEEVTGRTKEALFRPFNISAHALNESAGELRLIVDEEEKVFKYHRNWIAYQKVKRVGDIYVFSDITHLNKLKSELEWLHQKEYEADQKKQIYISNMNQVIRTVLNPLVGHVDYLKQLRLIPEDQEQVEMLSFSADILLKLINDITDYMRIETGSLKLQNSDFNLYEVFWHLVYMYQYEAEKKGIELLLDIAPNVPESIKGDPLRFTQILNNLISNAVKFTEKGHVSIRVAEEQGMLLINVADTGIGIGNDEQAAIFDAYQQENDQITLRFGGTGLGLAIVKEMVQLMNGSIAIESILGRGSVFILKIPYTSGQKKRLVEGYHNFKLQIDQEYEILILSDVPEHYESVQLYFMTCMKAQVKVCAFEAFEADYDEFKSIDMVIIDLGETKEGVDVDKEMLKALRNWAKEGIQFIGLTADLTFRKYDTYDLFDDYLLMPVGFDKMNKVFSRLVYQKQH